MDKSQKKTNYMYIVLAVSSFVVLIVILINAYYSGLRDGRQHRMERTNQNSN